MPPELKTNFGVISKNNPGRIVVVSLDETGKYWRLFTGMGGRSVGSRNRFYQELEDLNGHGNYVKTAVYDPFFQQGDPTTTLYIAQRQRRGWHVAGNGEQVEGISVALATGSTFSKGQRLYTNEGLNADYTARITAIVHFESDTVIFGQILRDPENHPGSIYRRYSNDYPGDSDLDYRFRRGEAFYLTTYNGEGGTNPNYNPPCKIFLPGTLEESMDLLWAAFDHNTRAGLAGKEIERDSGKFRYSFRSIHPGRQQQASPLDSL